MISASGFPSVWWMTLLSKYNEQQSREDLWVSRGIETSFLGNVYVAKGRNPCSIVLGKYKTTIA